MTKRNLIQPSGELRGQHLGEFQQRTSKLFDTKTAEKALAKGRSPPQSALKLKFSEISNLR